LIGSSADAARLSDGGFERGKERAARPSAAKGYRETAASRRGSRAGMRCGRAALNDNRSPAGREAALVTVLVSAKVHRVRPPQLLRWLFWDVPYERLDVARDASFILPRVLEFGRLVDVAWLVRRYGLERIHAFLRDSGHPELSRRTIAFWRALLDSKEETWASPPAWRRSSGVPWRG